VIEQRELKGKNILRDEVIRFTGPVTKKKCPYPLRIVEYYDEEKERTFVYLTNNLKLAASTIAGIYKERWKIETFFKALKQNIKIKTFIGTSPNAVKIQIWTALIAILLLKYLQLKSTFGWSLSNLAALLRMNLFTHRDLWEWINKPFETLPVQIESIQMELNLV
jgi:IS4 transposase